jgi:primosomal protein N'
VCYEEIWELDDSYEASAVKEISKVLDVNFSLSKLQCEIVAFMARYYIVAIHNVVSLFFPTNLLEKIKKETILKVTPKEYSYSHQKDILLSEKQLEIYKSISS